jgi:cell division septation protein DedD
MNHLLDDEEETNGQPERELTLSTGAILGIFLGLVVLCGAFFGFGYKMGSHSPVTPVATTATDTTPTPSANFNAFKPAAGSVAGKAAPAPLTAEPASPEPATSNPQDAPPEAAPLVRPSASPPAARGTNTLIPAVVPVGNFLVQVAAVSHKEDADLLVGALKAKGYPVASYSEPDKLFHIQVGPFNSRKDAEAVRQRLLADGYQPILK